MPTVRYQDRDVCSVQNCYQQVAMVRDYGDGWANYRAVCSNCHQKKLAEKHGKTVTQFKNQWHPYLRYRKDYCENTDGRLGFVCTTTIHWEGMLDVDHKNGDPSDNRPLNLQTLCKCCHAYKTVQNQDYLTPGRKALRLAA